MAVGMTFTIVIQIVWTSIRDAMVTVHHQTHVIIIGSDLLLHPLTILMVTLISLLLVNIRPIKPHEMTTTGTWRPVDHPQITMVLDPQLHDTVRAMTPWMLTIAPGGGMVLSMATLLPVNLIIDPAMQYTLLETEQLPDQGSDNISRIGAIRLAVRLPQSH